MLLDKSIFHKKFSILQKEKAYFKPINNNPNVIGEIGISSLLFDQYGLKNKDFYNTLMNPKYYSNNPNIESFSAGHPPEILKNLWYKRVVYHEFGHAYQSYLQFSQKTVLSNNLSSIQLNQKAKWIEDSFPLNKYEYTDQDSVKETMRGFLSAIYQEMYAENFALLCLGKELNFDQTFKQMAHVLIEARTGNFSYNIKTHPFKYDNHTITDSLKYFSTNEAKNLAVENYHNYASENTVKGFLDFISVLKNDLSVEKIKFIEEFEKEIQPILNNNFSDKLKLFRANNLKKYKI